MLDWDSGWVRYVVWVHAWQMQCCGDPFSVGDEVTWTLSDQPDRERLAGALGTSVAGSVTHAEDHHDLWPQGQVAVVGAGRVVSIRSAFCRYAPARTHDGILVPVAGSAVLHDVSRADGWENEADHLRFNGYLVTLDVTDEPG